MAEKKRRVLNGRYELDTLLGQGGMAKVFKGTDKVLGRTVAVKVLAPQFTGDEQFVARFRREAQSAAGLNHPNIVSVFDTGSQGGVHYIVMEYVEGRTLRDVIRGEGPLLPDRAVEIVDAVARALQAAHEAGLVHRDVKPGNIMVTASGEVKVMDFGIARTSTGDTLTQTAAVLGTASYLSPEQAQGQPVDARSDIYSLGCVLFEMLTGQPPFTGDSPVSIAYKHVKDDPVAPSRLNADVGPQLDAVVLKSMAKNPANRYQTAREMREDLDRLMAGMPTLATPVMGDTTQVVTRQHEGTQVMTGLPPDEEEEGGRRTWLVVLMTLLILGILGVAAFFLVRSLLTQPEPVAVPELIGLTEEAAVRQLEQAGLVPDVQTRFTDQEPPGIVFFQDPEPGEELREGDEVTIRVSQGVRTVDVPEVTGITQDEAAAILDEEGLAVGSVTPQSSDADPGIVIAQDPEAGAEVEEGSAVNLVISSGPAVVTVPDVICDPIDQARSEVQGQGLSFNITGRQFSAECPQDTVATQNPSGGTEVAPETTVNVVRSRGPEPSPSPSPEDND